VPLLFQVVKCNRSICLSSS